MEEKEILRILRADWETGCALVIEQYRHMLWGICARRLDDPEDIQECVLEALGDFCLRWDRFDPAFGSLKSYLAAIADRKALDKFRQNCRWERASQAAAQLTRERAARVRSIDFVRALETLEPDDVRILRMRYWKGMRYTEIASLLQIPYETVKKRGQRGLQKLRRSLEKAEKENA